MSTINKFFKKIYNNCKYIIMLYSSFCVGIYHILSNILVYREVYPSENMFKTFLIQLWFIYTNMFYNWKGLADFSMGDLTTYFKHCKIKTNNVSTVIKVLNYVQHYCQLEKIVFYYCSIDDNVLEKIFPNLKLLKELEIVGTSLTHNNTEQLIKLCQSGLLYLTIGCNRSNAYFFNILPNNITLKKLCIYEQFLGMNSIYLKNISDCLKNIDCLKSLKIDSKIYENGCIELVNILRNNRSIKKFEYTSTSNKFNATAHIIKYLTNDKILESVSLTNTRSIDKRIVTDLINMLKNNNTIKTLNLCDAFSRYDHLKFFIKYMQYNKNITCLKISHDSYNLLPLLKYIRNNYVLTNMIIYGGSEYLQHHVNEIMERNIQIKAEKIKSAGTV